MLLQVLKLGRGTFIFSYKILYDTANYFLHLVLVVVFLFRSVRTYASELVPSAYCISTSYFVYCDFSIVESFSLRSYLGHLKLNFGLVRTKV